MCVIYVYERFYALRWKTNALREKFLPIRFSTYWTNRFYGDKYFVVRNECIYLLKCCLTFLHFIMETKTSYIFIKYRRFLNVVAKLSTRELHNNCRWLPSFTSNLYWKYTVGPLARHHLDSGDFAKKDTYWFNSRHWREKDFLFSTGHSQKWNRRKQQNLIFAEPSILAQHNSSCLNNIEISTVQ